MTTRVGFVGAGRIGAPMVRRLVNANVQVTAFARRTEVRDQLLEYGAATVTELAAVGNGNDFVISCVYSDDQLLEIADELVSVIEPGTVLVSHTTGSPDTAEALAGRVRKRDADLVVAPFSGTADDVLAGRLTVVLGGREESLNRCEPVLRSYAGTTVRAGDIRSALILKLVNNMLFAANVQLALEVVRVTADLGVPLATVLEALRSSSGGTRALEHLGAFANADAFAAQVRPFLVKDVAVGEKVAGAADLDLGLLGEIVHVGSLAIDAG